MIYKIIDIDYLEQDAILEVNGIKHYFLFSGNEASLEQALVHLFTEGLINIRPRWPQAN